jgi:hypothetical protein
MPDGLAHRTLSFLFVAVVVPGWSLTLVSGGEPVVRVATDVFAEERIDLSGVQDVAGRRSRHRTDKAIQRVGYFEDGIGRDSVIFESTCGCETVCDCAVGDVYGEANCGVEASCGAETWIEPGCGCDNVGCDGIACGGYYCDGRDPNCECSVCCGDVGSFFPRLRLPWNRMNLFAGVAGFTGPMNYAETNPGGTTQRGAGSFGFYEGYNKGTSLAFFGTDLAYQTGVRFTQSNLSGAGFTDESRSQVFVTTGGFRRVDYGFQFGLVLDYLYDDWYYRSELLQLRGELGWVGRDSNVFGLRFAAGLNTDNAQTSVVNDAGTAVQNNISFEGTTQYRLFYRKHVARFGICEGFAGWTERQDGLLGLDLDLPLNRHWMWNTSATYLIPRDGTSNGGHMEEGWNVAIGFTYRPGGLGSQRYSHPLLNVADNGTFLVDRK